MLIAVGRWWRNWEWPRNQHHVCGWQCRQWGGSFCAVITDGTVPDSSVMPNQHCGFGIHHGDAVPVRLLP